MDYTNMPYIDGINWETASHYMPDKEMLFIALEDIVKYADDQAQTLIELKKTVENDPNPVNYKEYSVKAHAMKSNLRTLGADLFNEALMLEQAGKDYSEEIIKDKTDDFVKKYLELIDKLKPLVSANEEKTGFDEDTLFEKITCIKTAMEDFEINTLQENMRDITSMDIPDKYKKEIASLEIAVRDLDSDGVNSSCDALEKIRIW